LRTDRRGSKKNQKNNVNKPGLKEKVAEVLELPKEIVLNVPKLTMVGNGGLIIENYKGVIQYEETKVRINTSIGVIKIMGEGLVIKEITSENIMVDGKIISIEFNC
jgi:sporulation protein YqfC